MEKMSCLLVLCALEVMVEARPKISLLPSVSVTAAPSCLAGFPLLVALTMHNDDPNSDFNGLPDGDLLDSDLPIDVTFVDEHGHKTVVRSEQALPEEPNRDGLSLGPHEAYTMLLHLPGEQLPPGSYRVEIALVHGGARARAKPFALRITPPTAADARAAAALRAQNDEQKPSWVAFVTANWRTVDASKLTPTGHRALALHLFLHRAVYGPDPVERLDTRMLDELGAGPAEGEAALLRLEVLHARHDPHASEAEAVISRRFPGLRHRLQEIDQGEGRIARARRDFGAERSGRSAPAPYTHVDPVR